MVVGSLKLNPLFTWIVWNKELVFMVVLISWTIVSKDNKVELKKKRKKKVESRGTKSMITHTNYDFYT